MHRGRTTGKNSLAVIAFGSGKEKHAVRSPTTVAVVKCAILREIDDPPDAVRKLVAKLSRQYERLYEAGPHN
jgi:hypothetical protein